jgi:hypothetical protein
LGHQNITVHKPLLVFSSREMLVNSFPFSRDTTAFLLKAGNWLPTDTTEFFMLILLMLNNKQVGFNWPAIGGKHLRGIRFSANAGAKVLAEIIDVENNFL